MYNDKIFLFCCFVLSFFLLVVSFLRILILENENKELIELNDFHNEKIINLVKFHNKK